MSENVNATSELGNTRADSDAIAPTWHTVVVILLLLGVAALTMHVGREGRVGHMHRRMHAYIAIITTEGLIIAFIELSVWWHGVSVRTLVGENSARWRLIVLDLGLAVAFLVAADLFVFLLNYVLGRLMHPTASEAMKALLPQSRLEVAVFLLLALTAGICEEIIFRGYLQRQFAAWTNSAVIGIWVQGVAFGLAHAYQGPAQVILIAVYGCMFGVLARWRGSLRAGMVAHFLQDGIGGLLLARMLFH